jgi:hypothetical protein
MLMVMPRYKELLVTEHLKELNTKQRDLSYLKASNFNDLNIK